MKQFEEWEGFKGRMWKEEINTRDFIQENYTPYDGDASFLAGPTEATDKLWGILQGLQKEERKKGGVLDMDTDIVSSLTSHGPGYISEETKDLEQIVGLQTDKPLKRAFMPYGGIKMAEESCRNYGYEPSERLHEIFTKYYQVQLSSAFIGREDFGGIYAFYHPVLLEVSDVTFYAAMLTLVYTERIGKAWRMLVVKEQTGTFPSELAQLKSDIELFRRAVCDYEFKRYQEAEDTMVPLMERYPEVPGFVKFKSRFLMERARNGIDMVEAELYIDEALRLFPEDGYFLKYQGELLWMKGKCADALEVFADAREKTNNGITQLELDKFLNPYGRETVKTCQQLLDVGQKDGAMKLMALWYRLLPENPSVREYYYLARASVAKKRSEVEELIREILKRIDAERAESPGENNDIQIYKRALTKAWERLGYPGELARVRTDLVYTSEADDLEWLAERAKDGQIRKEKRAQVYKVIGDVRRKQGQTEAAFQNYLEALRQNGSGFVRTELSRIFLTDLYEGSKRAAVYAKAGDASEFLNQWLGKYGSIEEIQQLVKECL